MPFASVIPAVLTPFDERLELALDKLTDNARWLAEAGVRQVVACGTMGEAGALSFDERRAVIDAAAAGGVDVVVGISAADTGAAVRNAEQAAEAGALGVMCLPPTLYDATERELIAFFAAVCAASDLPVMLYNNPEAARSDLRPETIAAIADANPRVVAVKECSGDARRIAHILELCGERLNVLVGGDDWALEGYAAGAGGWVSGVANVAPHECLELERLVRAGDLEPAREIWRRLAPLSRLDMDPRLVQSFKAALDLIGRHGGPTRPPRLELDAADAARVQAAVAALAAPVAAR